MSADCQRVQRNITNVHVAQLTALFAAVKIGDVTGCVKLWIGLPTVLLLFLSVFDLLGLKGKLIKTQECVFLLVFFLDFLLPCFVSCLIFFGGLILTES